MSKEHTAQSLIDSSSDSLAALIFARLRALDRRILEADPQGALQSIQQQTLASKATGISYRPSQALSSAALAPLSATQRAVFILCRRDDLSFEEVARLLGVSAQTVHEALASALCEIVRHQPACTPIHTSGPE